MTELLTSAQMRAIETAAIESGEVTGLDLMERAGRGVVEAVFEEWPELAKTSHRAVVLCGPGNNGGDGFVVARLLKDWGWEVEVFLYGDPEKLPPDARTNYERWRELGEVSRLEDERFKRWPDEDSGVSLILDALFGTGLARGFEGFGNLRKTLNWYSEFADIAESDPRVVAVDSPSGLCADSGRWLGCEMPIQFSGAANLTVTFHSAKPGHFLAYGAESCGKVVVVDIGLSSTKKLGSLSRRTLTDMFGDPRLGRNLTSVLSVDDTNAHGTKKVVFEHKYAHGHALILSGPLGTGGAARLAARGALRIGAGLVSVVCDDTALAEHAAQLTAIMIKAANGADDLTALLEDPRFNALCLGPGLGYERARALVPVALSAHRATVLDADALTAFRDDPEDLFGQLHDSCVLTPHAGEFARLFPDIAQKLNAVPTKGPAFSKVDATRDAAARAGCVVLFKGPDTVIAAPDGRCSISSAQYERAAPWLATAGSGDVLAGFITGLLARGMDPMQAAETAAWLHVECARGFGPGLIAEDLPEALPKVFRALDV